MPFTTDFKAFATGPNALVITPLNLAEQSWLQSGFIGGIADAASMNTLWRQSTFVAAGITQWMANTLSQNIFDDGNLNNFISLFASSLTKGSNGGVTSFNTRTGAVTLNSTDVSNALGYLPVRSFNGPGGTPRNGIVTLLQVDITEALGFTPINKGGDTISGGFLSGPEPSTGSNYATKNYVDRSLAGTITGAISSIGSPSGSAMEWDFPLPFGGIMKIGQWLTGGPTGSNPATASMQPNTGYQITFAKPFPNVCAGVTLEAIGVSQGKNDVLLAATPTTGSITVWALTNGYNLVGQSHSTIECFTWGVIWIAYGF